MSSPARATVLSLGSINADFQLRIDRAEDFGSGAGPGRDLARLSGGKAGNVAVQARRLGCEAWLVGRVGDDALARQALAGPEREGVELRGLRRAACEQTGMAVLAVTPDGGKRSVSAGEANGRFDAQDLDAMEAVVHAAPAGAVLAVDYEITPGAASRGIAAARARGMAVVVDPSFPHQVQRDDLAGVAVITPNEREARALARAGADVPLAEVARRLAALGPRAVCIKLRGGGCLLLQDGRALHQQSAPTRAVDTSGAGDAFTATLAASLAQGRDLHEAVLRAVAATELAVTRYGSQPSYPTEAQLQARLADGAPRPLRDAAG